ncbi:MAG: peptide ABC transporter substrate-binding protein [Aggregatilineales bacterium]
MLRGFRWQFLAFVLALIVFFVVLLTRPTESDEPELPQTQPTLAITATDNVPAQAVTTETVITPLPTTVPEVTSSASIAQSVAVNGVSTFREALIGNVQRLNPLYADLNPVDRDISSLIFEGLTRINEYGEPEPALAQSWVVSFDQLEYVVSLREDVLWQDGVPFTASDVIFTTTLLSASDFSGDSSLGAFWRTVEVEQLGEYMIRFRLSQPLSSFLEALRIGILPEHALRGTSASNLASHPFNLDPIGTGAYQLESFGAQNGQIGEVNLRVSPIYRERLQRDSMSDGYSVERLTFKLYADFDSAIAGMQNGAVDGFASTSRTQRLQLLDIAARSTEFVAITTVEPTIGMVIFNWDDESFPIFTDRRVRQALQIGLDRSSIIERELSNVAVLADSPIPLNSWANEPNLTWTAFDPAFARDLLSRVAVPEPSTDESAEATAEPDADVTVTARLTFNLLTPDDPSLVRVAEEVAAQWEQIDPGNIDVRVEPVATDIYLSRLDSGDFDTALVELSKNGNADPDMYNFWHQGQYPDGQNYGAANDRTISELLERGRQDWVGTNRVVHYRRFQQEFVQNAIAIPLYYPLYTYLVRENVDGVQLGFMASPSDRFQTLMDWTIR